MAHVNRKVNPYPYYGSFYRKAEEDYSIPLDQRVVEDELVLETACDIQEVSKAANPVLIATYSIFFPWNPDEDIPITRGVKFLGYMGNIQIEGMVTNVVLSQIGGVVAYVKDYYAE